MARIPRKHQLVGYFVYHVLNRGNQRISIFNDKKDYLRFKNTLIRYKKEYCFKVYHWIFIPNHFHLEIELPNPENISELMARWLGGYSRYYRRKYDSAGHHWQGRFKSQPIHKELYLLKCGRYIERNAMRAGLVELPWDYEWSSCKAYVLGLDDGLTDEDSFYRSMGRSRKERQEAYRNWLMEGEDKQFRGAKGVVADQMFMSRLRMGRGRLLPRRRGRPSPKA